MQGLDAKIEIVAAARRKRRGRGDHTSEARRCFRGDLVEKVVVGCGIEIAAVETQAHSGRSGRDRREKIGDIPRCRRDEDRSGGARRTERESVVGEIPEIRRVLTGAVRVIVIARQQPGSLRCGRIVKDHGRRRTRSDRRTSAWLRALRISERDRDRLAALKEGRFRRVWINKERLFRFPGGEIQNGGGGAHQKIRSRSSRTGIGKADTRGEEMARAPDFERAAFGTILESKRHGRHHLDLVGSGELRHEVLQQIAGPVAIEIDRRSTGIIPETACNPIRNTIGIGVGIARLDPEEHRRRVWLGDGDRRTRGIGDSGVGRRWRGRGNGLHVGESTAGRGG